MSSPSDDDADSELSRYAPKWGREQPGTPDAERPRSSIALWSTENHQNLMPRSVPEPPAQQREDGLLARVSQTALSGGSGGSSRIVSCLCETTIGGHKLSQFGFAE